MLHHLRATSASWVLGGRRVFHEGLSTCPWFSRGTMPGLVPLAGFAPASVRTPVRLLCY